MPAIFTVRTVVPNNGIIKVHLSLDRAQPNEVWFNVTREVLADIFGDEVCEGDAREISVRLIDRAGTNGRERI